MCLIPFDYDAMRPAPDRSLLQLRSLIDTFRHDDVPTLLCDTGDFLQGNAMADLAADSDDIHPMIAAFNDMQYDAVVPGNHDFDYGLESIRTAFADLNCPAIAANLRILGAPLTAPYVIVPLETKDGIVRVGLLGLTTQPTMRSMSQKSSADVLVNDPIKAAKVALPQMKAAGADLIVVLSHFGILPGDPDENVAGAIAALPQVDAVMAGHTHDVFPGPDVPPTDDIDPVAGRVHGKPAVMAGAYGQHLGVIDFALTKIDGAWRISSATSRVLNAPKNPVPPPLSRPGAMALHDATVRYLRTEVAQTATPISTAFNMLAPDMGQHLLAQSRIAAITVALANTDHAGLPVIGSAAPFTAGNKGAPLTFLETGPGAVTRGDVIGIFPFQDAVIGLRRTGMQILAWLEQAAGRYNRLVQGETQQMLVDPAFPPYNFTTVYGLTYTIDPSRPVGTRISDLRHAGAPVRPSDIFVVATTPHRNFSDMQSNHKDTLVMLQDRTRDILTAYLVSLKAVPIQPIETWRLATLQDTFADILTSPTASAQSAPYRAQDMGLTASGHRRFRIALN